MTREEARGLLIIDKNRLDVVCETHASTYGDIAVSLANAINDRDALKDELETLYAEIDSSIRAEHSGEKGWTEARIENVVAMDADYIEVKIKYNSLNAEVNEWAALKEAFSQRGYMIRELCEIYKTGYFNTIPETTTQETAYERGREILRNGR